MLPQPFRYNRSDFGGRDHADLDGINPHILEDRVDLISDEGRIDHLE